MYIYFIWILKEFFSKAIKDKYTFFFPMDLNMGARGFPYWYSG